MSGKFALIIGNTEYIDSGLAQLTAPGKDAEDFARVLQDKDLCAFNEVKILLNQLSSSVIETIDEFFDQKKPDDMLVLYFSGHGVRDEMGLLYLAVKNTIRSRLRSTAIRSDYIREAMDQSRSKRQILILDCCNSGAFPQGTKAEVGGTMGMTRAFQGYGRFVLTASDATQFAWEGEQVIGQTDNSLFTHFLVKGLEGEADSDGDGKITVDELYDYAYGQISSVTPKQTPTKSASKQEGEIVLRQFTRLEDIKPIALPDDLISEIEDFRPAVREWAVQRLEKILQGKNIGMARSAVEALEKIAADENTTRRVAQMATQVLESYRQVEKQAEEAKKAREDAERLAALKAEEERLALEKAEAERKTREEVEKLARAKAEREAAEQEAARLKTEREAAEKAARDAAEKAAKEKAEREAAEWEVAQMAEQEAIELAARKRAEREAAEKAEREAIELATRRKEEREAKEKVVGRESTVTRPLLTKIGVIGGIVIGLIFGGYLTMKYLSSLSVNSTVTPPTRRPPVATTEAPQPLPISTTAVPIDQPVPKVEQVLIQVTVPPGQVGEAHADCPNGSIVTGGGYATGGSLIVFTENMLGNGWSVFAQNNSTVEDLLNAYAICLFDTTGITTQAYVQASVLPGETGNPVVECPTGSIVTGGGYTTDPTISVHNSSMSDSGKGWGIYAVNNTANEILINANAVCLSNISGSTTMVGSQVSIPEGEIGNPIAECPAGTLVTSGGFATDTVLSIYNSSLLENGWQVYAQHNPSGYNLLNVYAICLTIQ